MLSRTRCLAAVINFPALEWYRFSSPKSLRVVDNIVVDVKIQELHRHLTMTRQCTSIRFVPSNGFVKAIVDVDSAAIAGGFASETSDNFFLIPYASRASRMCRDSG